MASCSAPLSQQPRDAASTVGQAGTSRGPQACLDLESRSSSHGKHLLVHPKAHLKIPSATWCKRGAARARDLYCIGAPRAAAVRSLASGPARTTLPPLVCIVLNERGSVRLQRETLSSKHALGCALPGVASNAMGRSSPVSRERALCEQTARSQARNMFPGSPCRYRAATTGRLRARLPAPPAALQLSPAMA